MIDHQALKARRSAEIDTFLTAHWPVVLLANGTPVDSPESFRIVTKPMLGAALTHAVREAVTGSMPTGA